jgi:D-alanyl-D-alanine carboxypeptidase
VGIRVWRAGGWSLAVVLLAAGCGSAELVAGVDASTGPAVSPTAISMAPAPTRDRPDGPSPSSTAIGATPTSTEWVLGARPLPQNPDGSVPPQETPPELQDRQLPTLDLLPPPAGGRFAASIDPVTADIRQRMGSSWSPGCPVPLEELRYLTLTFWGFDDRPHTGELVVNVAMAEEVVEVFRELFDAQFPIEEMRLVTTADLQAAPTGDGNNTAAFVCRTARGSTRYSEHAYGLAVDVNPFQNPYIRGETVLPELARSYTDRTVLRPGMLVEGSPAVTAFTRRGWEWGGAWRSVRDPMHFSTRGG